MNKTTKKTRKSAAAVAAPEAQPATLSAAKPAPVASKTTAAPARPAVGTVSFALERPGAKHVSVAGSFNGWRTEAAPLKPAGEGRWIGNLNLGPGRHEYLFVVDGQWLPDPNAPESVANPFGGRNSVVIVSE